MNIPWYVHWGVEMLGGCFIPMDEQLLTLTGAMNLGVKTKEDFVTGLAQKVSDVCEETFQAPPDFHDGNLMVTESGNSMFFDTGTPSDWEYFLSVSKSNRCITGRGT